MKLADSRPPPWTVGLAVDQEAARSANPLAAVMIKGDRLFAAADQLFIQDVEHLQKRHVGRHIFDLIGDESARCRRVFLPPDCESQVHGYL